MSEAFPPAKPPQTKSAKRGLIIAGIVSLGVLAIYLLAATFLIFWPRESPFDVSRTKSHVFVAENVSNEYTTRMFTMSDGTKIAARLFGPDTDTLIIMMHGVASSQEMMKIPALMLQKSTGTQIMTIDLRGHGRSGGAPQDVPRIGQYEDDLIEIMTSLKRETPKRHIVLAGHSMGGGVAMRYALKKNAPTPAAYLLIAPNFGEGPTEKKHDKTAPPKPADQPSFVHFDTPRMIGQIMMNTLGLHMFDSEPVLFFNFPPKPKAYSYRAVMSAQPVRPNTSDKALQALTVPLLVQIGSKDEVFYAAAYDDFVSANSLGSTRLIESEGHVSVLFSPKTHDNAANWLRDLGLAPKE